MGQNRAKTNLYRAKLGESLYDLKNFEFILTDPNMHVIRPDSCNRLHDPHTCRYFHRKDLHSNLQEKNFITEDNEVICTLREYKSHKSFLETLKRASDRAMNEIQKDQLWKFLKCREEGRIPSDVTLAEVIEIVLDEEVRGLRQQLRGDVEWRKLNKRPIKREQKYFKELHLQKWKAEEAARLWRVENEVRHEWNRERHLKEAQEKRQSKKLATLVQKCANQEKKLEEKIKISEDLVKKERSQNKTPRQSPAQLKDSLPIKITHSVASNVIKPSKPGWAYWTGNR